MNVPSVCTLVRNVPVRGIVGLVGLIRYVVVFRTYSWIFFECLEVSFFPVCAIDWALSSCSLCHNLFLFLRLCIYYDWFPLILCNVVFVYLDVHIKGISSFPCFFFHRNRPLYGLASLSVYFFVGSIVTIFPAILIGQPSIRHYLLFILSWCIGRAIHIVVWLQKRYLLLIFFVFVIYIFFLFFYFFLIEYRFFLFSVFGGRLALSSSIFKQYNRLDTLLFEHWWLIS